LIGGGATYDAVEGRFRKIKKDAAALQAKVDSGELPEAPLRGGLANKLSPTKATTTTPRKQRTPGAPTQSTNSFTLSP